MMMQGSSYDDDEPEFIEDSYELENQLARQQVNPKYRQNPLQDVYLGKKLGRGAFGDVYVGQIGGLPENRVVAVKCISKRAVSKRGLSTQLAMEIAVHQSLVHTNIIEFYDFSQDGKKVYFFLEYAPNGDLLKYMKNFRPDEGRIADIVYQVGQGLAFVHSHGVVHRDLKPENILMDANHVPKLTDFGYCDRIGPDGYCENPLFCGTTDYFCYTTIDDEPCSYFVDVWAFGVLIFDLLTGYPPFEARTRKETYRRIRSCQFDYRHPAVMNCRRLLQRIFVPYPEEIPSIVEVLTDDWFTL